MERTDRRQDVLILGGGPAGLATAFRIVKGGGTAVVVERGRYDAIRIGEHLSPAGVGLLRSAGFSDPGDAAHLRCAGVSAWWGGKTPNYSDYLFHPVGHGLNLSRPHFDSDLAEQCRSAGAQILSGARVIQVARTARGWRADVHCDDRIRQHEPRLVVDATGPAAAFAHAQGSSIEARDSQVGLIAFRASTAAVDPAGGRVAIESAEDGWWYFAPLTGGRCVCMFMMDADLLAATHGSALALWEHRLKRTLHLRACVDQYPALTKFMVRSARSQRLDHMSGRAWVAVGDAAIAFDPLSSHGIEKGIAHGWQAADAALAYLGGDDAALEGLSDRFAAEFADYERTRLGYYKIERRWPDAPFWRRRQPSCRAARRSTALQASATISL
jgi:flavin-dependent dehydrogenase